jgi:thioredoxin 1
MSVHVKSDEEFNEYTKKAFEEKKYIVVKFSSTWCGPCKKIQPQFDQLSRACNTAYCLSVDVDECQDVAALFKISALPTFLVLSQGVVKGTLQGANPQGLVTMFASVNAKRW